MIVARRVDDCTTNNNLVAFSMNDGCTNCLAASRMFLQHFEAVLDTDELSLANVWNDVVVNDAGENVVVNANDNDDDDDDDRLDSLEIGREGRCLAHLLQNGISAALKEIKIDDLLNNMDRIIAAIGQ